MFLLRPVSSACCLGAALLLAGCDLPTTQIVTNTPAAPAPVAAPTPPPAPVGPFDPVNPIEDVEAPGAFASLDEPDVPLFDGYRNVNDPCRIAGESRFTRKYLDDSSDLVACLRGGGAERTLAAVSGAIPVAQTPSYTLFTVPKGAVPRAVAG